MAVWAQVTQAQDVNKLFNTDTQLRNVRVIEIVWEIDLYPSYA